MLKPSLTSILLAFLIGVGVAGWLATRKTPAAARTSKLPTNLLARHTGPMEFDHLSLREAVDRLATQTRSSIIVDWRSLDHVNISPEDVVHLGFGDVPLEKGLQLVFRYDRSAGVLERDGVVYVDDASVIYERTFIPRLHDLRDLAVPAPRAGIDPLLERQEMIDQLIRSIMKIVEPDCWSHVGGGGGGSIRMIGDVMLVYLHPESQEQVGNLLANIRATRMADPARRQPLRSGIDPLSNPSSVH